MEFFSLKSILMALLFGFQLHVVQAAEGPTVIRVREESVKSIFFKLENHASFYLDKDRLKAVEEFEPSPEIKNVYERFFEKFGLADQSFDFQFSFPQTRFVQNFADRRWAKFVFPNDLQTSYFVTPKEPTHRRLQIIAPLRLDSDLVVFAASTGPFEAGLDTRNFTASPLMIAIGVRLDELDNLEQAPDLSIEDQLRYTLRLNTMTPSELEKELRIQLSQTPDAALFATRQFRPVNFDRLNYNLVARNLSAEIRDFVESAGHAVGNGHERHALNAFSQGGLGFLRAADGTQYYVRTLFLSPPVLDSEVAFVNRLLDPSREIRKRIKLPQSVKKGIAFLEKMKSKRAKADAQLAINATFQNSLVKEKESVRVMQLLMNSLRTPDQILQCLGLF